MKPGRLISPPGTYFVNFSTWQRRTLFVVESYARRFLKTLYGYRREGKFSLHAFVVMPEHVHLMLTPSEDVTIERAIQLIKGGFSHTLGSEIGRNREIWQRGLRTIAFVTRRISRIIASTFIRTRSCADW